MSRTLHIILCFLCYTSSAYAQEWKEYSTSDIAIADFSIETPVEMFYVPKVLKTSLGEIPSEVHYGYNEDAKILYMINYVQYPEYSFHPDSTELIDDYLDESIKSMAENAEGEVVYTSNAPKYDHAKLFRIKYNQGQAVLKGKAILMGDRYYMLQVFAPTSMSLNDDIDTFLGSFKINE